MHLYVMEPADDALGQIRERHYADRFLMEKDILVHSLGIGFGKEHHRLESRKEEIP